MPGKSSFPHSHVQICSVDTRDLCSKNIQQVGQFCNIPDVAVILEQRTRHIGSIHRLSKCQTFPVCSLQFGASLGSKLFQIIHVVVETFEGSLVNDIVGLCGVVHSA